MWVTGTWQATAGRWEFIYTVRMRQDWRMVLWWAIGSTGVQRRVLRCPPLHGWACAGPDEQTQRCLFVWLCCKLVTLLLCNTVQCCTMMCKQGIVSMGPVGPVRRGTGQLVALRVWLAAAHVR